MIHRQTFQFITQQIIDQPEHIPELLLNLLNLNQAEIPTIINFNTASTDAINNLWWIQRLANRKGFPDGEDVSAKSIAVHLSRLQSEYWFQLQKLCRNSGFLTLTAFNNVLGSRDQEINQGKLDDPYGMQPLYSFWNQYGEAIKAIMDSDEQYRYLDQFFHSQPIVAISEVNNDLINHVMVNFNSLKYHYVARVMYLNNAYGNYAVPRIPFDQTRQKMEFVHDEFKGTLKHFFDTTGGIINDVINERNGSTPNQVANVQALIDISNGLIPINDNDAQELKSVLINFDSMHKEFLFRQIIRLESTTFLAAKDFQPVLDYWENCQTIEERSDVSIFSHFLNQHRNTLIFLCSDFTAFKFMDRFLSEHPGNDIHVQVTEALELHDQFIVMKELYLATVDVIKSL